MDAKCRPAVVTNDFPAGHGVCVCVLGGGGGGGRDVKRGGVVPLNQWCCCRSLCSLNKPLMCL